MSTSLFQPGYLPAQLLAGNVFIGSSAAAGVTIPAFTATAQVFGLWNPLGSGVEIVPLALEIGIATGATPVVADLGLCYLPNAGGQVATGGQITAFTSATPVNARLGLGNRSKALFTPSAATIAAPSFLMSIGLSFASTTAGTGVQYGQYDFNGMLSLPPNNYIGLGSSTIQSGTIIAATLFWMELPYSG
jgi:hypothetical protein